MNSRHLLMGSLLGGMVISGCVFLAGTQLDTQFGKSSPHNRLKTTTPDTTVKYWKDVKPILEARCIVCHGCYDAPCQLNLSAYEGIDRGANKERVYNSGRLFAVQPTRLFVDAHSPSEWRERNFFPVLNERAQTREANLQAGVMARMLELKRQHPLPQETPLPESFDFSLDRGQYCPRIEEFEVFAERKPLWGMPYGLPNLEDREYRTLRTWLEEGARSETPPPTDPKLLAQVDQWESFLNGGTAKEQLMSRYLYEHLFLANLYFEDLASREFFHLVRSASPPGQPIDLIATRRPYDDPKVERVYYRFQLVRTSILSKTHMPYALSDRRMNRYRALFLDIPYEVEALPSYEHEASANPFETFKHIPAKSRYQFLLDEAQFTLMNFIKGPVCRGQIALNVINEHFWIVFANPEDPALEHAAKIIEKEHQNLRLPTEEQSNATALQTWVKYSGLEKQYLKGKFDFIREHLATPGDISLDLVWNGDGQNPNAALTVFRNLNNATVLKGFVGDEPKTLVLLEYPLLERIHYLLVAGYDVYGNIGHQLNSRLYMDFLRMEGELNFLTLLPEKVRVEEWKYWYRDAGGKVEDFGTIYNSRVNRDTDIQFQTSDHKSELVGMLKQHLAPVLRQSRHLEKISHPQVRHQLERLSHVTGTSVSWLPQLAFLTIHGEEDHIVTLVHNNGMSNVSHLFFEDQRRLPDEDSLTLIHGFVGAYPNAFFDIQESELEAFVDGVAKLGSEKDYRTLLDRFGLRRNDPRFWEHSDFLHKAYQRLSPVKAGLFDYSRLENR